MVRRHSQMWTHTACDAISDEDYRHITNETHPLWAQRYKCPMCRKRDMYRVLDALRAEDAAKSVHLFLNPVADIVPDYASYISTPMDLKTMKEYVDRGLYLSPVDFRSDFSLMVKNALEFNSQQLRGIARREALRFHAAGLGILAKWFPMVTDAMDPHHCDIEKLKNQKVDKAGRVIDGAAVPPPKPAAAAHPPEFVEIPFVPEPVLASAHLLEVRLSAADAADAALLDVCGACGSTVAPGVALVCIDCAEVFHDFCLSASADTVKRSVWRCPNCKICEVCGDCTLSDDANLLLCELCDRGFHMNCIMPKLTAVPDGSWFCGACVVCKQCSASAKVRSMTWSSSSELCYKCVEASSSGVDRCPLCSKAYGVFPCIQCDACDQWVHAECDLLTEDDMQHSPELYSCPNCRARELGARLDGARTIAGTDTFEGALARLHQVDNMMEQFPAVIGVARYRLSVLQHALGDPPTHNVSVAGDGAADCDGDEPRCLRYRVRPGGVRQFSLTALVPAVPGTAAYTLATMAERWVRRTVYPRVATGPVGEGRKAGVTAFFSDASGAAAFLMFLAARDDAWWTQFNASNSLTDNEIAVLRCIPVVLARSVFVAAGRHPAMCTFVPEREIMQMDVGVTRVIDAAIPRCQSRLALFARSSTVDAEAKLIARRYETPAVLPPAKRVVDPPLAQPLAASTRPRLCVLCSQQTEDGMEGRLIPCPELNGWVHVLCALWTSDVMENEHGMLVGSTKAIMRCRRIKCAHCNTVGASIGCCARNCKRVYHLRCGVAAGVDFRPADKSAFCRGCAPTPPKPKVVKRESVAPGARQVPQVTGPQQQAPLTAVAISTAPAGGPPAPCGLAGACGPAGGDAGPSQDEPMSGGEEVGDGVRGDAIATSGVHAVAGDAVAASLLSVDADMTSPAEQGLVGAARSVSVASGGGSAVADADVSAVPVCETPVCSTPDEDGASVRPSVSARPASSIALSRPTVSRPTVVSPADIAAAKSAVQRFDTHHRLKLDACTTPLPLQTLPRVARGLGDEDSDSEADDAEPMSSMVAASSDYTVVRVGAMVVQRWGRIVWRTAGFNTPTAIYPRGFRSKRIFWHPHVPWARAAYLCEVLAAQDGGEETGEAIFQISCDAVTPTVVLRGGTTDGMCGWPCALPQAPLLTTRARAQNACRACAGCWAWPAIRISRSMPRCTAAATRRRVRCACGSRGLARL